MERRGRDRPVTPPPGRPGGRRPAGGSRRDRRAVSRRRATARAGPARSPCVGGALRLGRDRVAIRAALRGTGLVTPRVAAMVLARDRPEPTKRTLDALLAQEPAPDHLLLVENDATPEVRHL